jgi:hypothetical protein
MLKKYSLLALRDGGNRVLADVDVYTSADAIAYFNSMVDLIMLDGTKQRLQLDKHGYFKDGPITYTIAEHFR